MRSLAEARGTASRGASAEELAQLRGAVAALPEAIEQLLAAQNGEPVAYRMIDGVRFLSAPEIARSSLMLRDMVESDETLPSCFLSFVPFMHTELKTEVGLFAGASPAFPGSIAELHYETGELVRWASSLSDFLRLMLGRGANAAALGRVFPGPEAAVVSIHDMPGWPTEA